MKSIKMILGGKEVAKITENSFEEKLQRHPYGFNLVNLYDACFYGMHLNTFDERYEAVKEGSYFCYQKPSLKLEAAEF